MFKDLTGERAYKNSLSSPQSFNLKEHFPKKVDYLVGKKPEMFKTTLFTAPLATKMGNLRK